MNKSTKKVFLSYSCQSATKRLSDSSGLVKQSVGLQVASTGKHEVEMSEIMSVFFFVLFCFFFVMANFRTIKGHHIFSMLFVLKYNKCG